MAKPAMQAPISAPSGLSIVAALFHLIIRAPSTHSLTHIFTLLSHSRTKLSHSRRVFRNQLNLFGFQCFCSSVNCLIVRNNCSFVSAASRLQLFCGWKFFLCLPAFYLFPKKSCCLLLRIQTVSDLKPGNTRLLYVRQSCAQLAYARTYACAPTVVRPSLHKHAATSIELNHHPSQSMPPQLLALSP